MDTKAKARAALSGKGKSEGNPSGKLHVHEMSIRHAHNGGHIVTHHMRDDKGMPPDNPADATQENAIPPGQLVDHIQQSGMADGSGQPQDATQPVAGGE